MKYDVDFSSKYVISVKFSICESKKVAVQPYSGDELCSAISWKDMESGIDTIQCKISCSHIFERISIALLKVKIILWALWVGRFSPLRQCVLRTHMHTAVTAGLYYISPVHDILSLDFVIVTLSNCYYWKVQNFASPWYDILSLDFGILCIYGIF